MNIEEAIAKISTTRVTRCSFYEDSSRLLGGILQEPLAIVPVCSDPFMICHESGEWILTFAKSGQPDTTECYETLEEAVNRVCEIYKKEA
jgi:hypothetical protein